MTAPAHSRWPRAKPWPTPPATPASAISVFVDVDSTSAAVFVRDRGKGFVPAAVPPDRQGIAESIRGRMERAGGEALITTTPGEGTEVELRLATVAP